MESHGHVTYSLFHRHCGAAASLIHRFFISSLNPFFSLINNNSCLPTIRYIYTHREIYIYKIISLRNTFLTSYSFSLSFSLSIFLFLPLCAWDAALPISSLSKTCIRKNSNVALHSHSSIAWLTFSPNIYDNNIGFVANNFCSAMGFGP